MPDASPHLPADGSLSVGQRIGQVESAVIGLANRVDKLESWRDELQGMTLIVKAIFGTSILTGIVALLTLYLLLTGKN